MKILNRISAVTFLVLLSGTAFAQYTAPSPSAPDSAKKKQTMTLRTLRITPVPVLRANVDNAGIDSAQQFSGERMLPASLVDPREIHLTNIRQLTSSGINTVPRWNASDRLLTFEARGLYPDRCDQTYTMHPDGTHVKRISNGYGKTASADFVGNTIIYSTTQASFGGACPQVDSANRAYWPLFRQDDIYIADTNGNLLRRITNDTTYYDAELSSSTSGNVLFTSTRSGDIDIYATNANGGGLKQLTHTTGYDGQASYSPDATRIVFVTSKPGNATLYHELLSRGVLQLGTTDIAVMDADGSHTKMLTHNAAVNSAPCWSPDGKWIVYASNANDGTFQLYRISSEGKGEPEQLTFGNSINFYPSFSHDGKHLLFSSTRNTQAPNGMNLYIADWKD